VACGGDGFRKMVRRLKLCHHGPGHVNKSQFHPLGYTILLRGIGRGILRTNSLFTKKLIQGVVLELRGIVTSYSKNGEVVLTLNLIGKVDETLLSLNISLS
jgi:hypothetical protein